MLLPFYLFPMTDNMVNKNLFKQTTGWNTYSSFSSRQTPFPQGFVLHGLSESRSAKTEGQNKIVITNEQINIVFNNWNVDTLSPFILISLKQFSFNLLWCFEVFIGVRYEQKSGNNNFKHPEKSTWITLHILK